MNHRFGKPLPIQVLDAAAEVNGQKVYAYDAVTFTLINGVPFRSLRSTVKNVASYIL